MRHIKIVAPNQQQRPHRLELAAHGGEKAQHIGVMQDWLTFLAFERGALHAVTCIADRLLIGAFRKRQSLQPDIKTRRIHHQEHTVEATVLLTKQIANCPVFLPILQHRCRRGLDAQLFFDRQAAHIIRRAKAAIFIDQNFWYDEQRNPLHTRRRVRQTRKHQMDDVLAHVMFAISDIDLLAADTVMVAVGRRCRAQRR
ncbi:MAG: Uncharacterised protein [SAR116 cluster bacterium]|nr:MAG: Uncharacterised protein [SAR116 cluster bacterium]